VTPWAGRGQNWPCGSSPLITADNLLRLSVTYPGSGCPASLAELQRRHLDAVPYEPRDHARAAQRRVCDLGVAVERRFGQVRGRAAPQTNHLALLATNDGQRSRRLSFNADNVHYVK
jgi:hypothetical protein